MMQEIPTVGSVVRVTTRYPNHYYYATEPFVDHVYEGTVLPTEKFNKPTTFNMTGDERTRLRNIDVGNVVSLTYIKGKGTKAAVRAFKVVSKDKTYTVTLIGNKFECNCLGFQYRHKCKHSDGVKAKIEVK